MDTFGSTEVSPLYKRILIRNPFKVISIPYNAEKEQKRVESLLANGESYPKQDTTNYRPRTIIL
jgi:hypothetical protein